VSRPLRELLGAPFLGLAPKHIGVFGAPLLGSKKGTSFILRVAFQLLDLS